MCSNNIKTLKFVEAPGVIVSMKPLNILFPLFTYFIRTILKTCIHYIFYFFSFLFTLKI